MGAPAYAIFEGGGAKGIAHIAGLRAAEKNGLEFAGVAGASAGALIAALAAVGYSADELFNPDTPDTNLLTRHKMSPLSLVGEAEWETFRRAQSKGSSAIKALLLGGGLAAWAFGGDAYRVARILRASGGYFSTEKVREQLNTFLRRKLIRHHADAGRDIQVPDRVRFRDIDPAVVPECCSLKIVVTDVTHRKMVVFDNSPKFADVEVAEAVAASIAIPVVFKPAQIPSYPGGKEAYYADGGLVSNMPVWIFAEEKLNYERSFLPQGRVPIVGFSIVEPAEANPVPPAPGSLAYWISLGRSAVFGGQGVVQRFISDLLPVEMPIGIGVTEFDFTRQRGLDGYEEAYAVAMRRLSREIRLRPPEIRKLMAALEAEVHPLIQGHPGTKAAIGTLRFSVLHPEGGDSLRVVYTHNMEADPDDRLSFRLEMKGAPVAYNTRSFAYVDFAAMHGAGGTDYMTKYEFALLRRSTCSAICLPLFKDPDEWNKPAADRAPLGIVCIDSVMPLSHIFGDQEAMTAVMKATLPLAANLSA
jgi:predicted acylesterase/phospholipase RssA